MSEPLYRLVLRPLPTPQNAHELPPEDVPFWCDAPPQIRLRHVLKRLLRQYGLECVQVQEIETVDDPGEVDRLRAIIEGLAARVASQSELLSRRAEVPTSKQ